MKGSIVRSFHAALVLAIVMMLLTWLPTNLLASEGKNQLPPGGEDILTLEGGAATLTLDGDEFGSTSVGETEFGVGVAFDGSHIWYTLGYAFDTSLYRMDPTTETVVTTLDMMSLTGRNIVPGGLAWDSNRDHLWVATLFDLDAVDQGLEWQGEIFEVDPVQETIVSSFPTVSIIEGDEPLAGVIDGLAFNHRTDTLWFSPSESVRAYEVTIEGSLVSSFALQLPEEIWIAGLTFDGNHLWLSLRTGGDHRGTLPGFREVSLMEFTTEGVPLMGLMEQMEIFGSEDLAFDPVTFAPTCVVWLASFTNPLTSIEIPCPLQVEATLHPGDSLQVDKEITLDPLATGMMFEQTADVWWEVECDAQGVTITLQPQVYEDVEVGSTLSFEEWIEVPAETAAGEYYCVVTFITTPSTDTSAPFEEQHIWVTVEASESSHDEEEDEGEDDANPIAVPLDIKPGSCRNPLNVKSKGVLPVAILGTEDFDVSQIDTSTIALEGVAPLRWSMEDVATPFEPYTGKQDAFDCTDEGPDGFMDLTLKFDTQAIVEALGEVSDGDVVVLEISGKLLDGTEFVGEDVVVIIKKGK